MNILCKKTFKKENAVRYLFFEVLTTKKLMLFNGLNDILARPFSMCACVSFLILVKML